MSPGKWIFKGMLLGLLEEIQKGDSNSESVKKDFFAACREIGEMDATHVDFDKINKNENTIKRIEKENLKDIEEFFKAIGLIKED